MEDKRFITEESSDNSDYDIENIVESIIQPKAFYIYVKNGVNACETEVYITKKNLLCQVYELARRYIGIVDANIVFENEKGQRTSNMFLSLEELDVSEGSTITIYSGYSGICGIDTILYDIELDKNVWSGMVEVHSPLNDFLG